MKQLLTAIQVEIRCRIESVWSFIISCDSSWINFCYSAVNLPVLGGGCSCFPITSQTCSIDERSDELAGYRRKLYPRRQFWESHALCGQALCCLWIVPWHFTAQAAQTSLRFFAPSKFFPHCNTLHIMTVCHSIANNRSDVCAGLDTFKCMCVSHQHWD